MYFISIFVDLQSFHRRLQNRSDCSLFLGVLACLLTSCPAPPSRPQQASLHRRWSHRPGSHERRCYDGGTARQPGAVPSWRAVPSRARRGSTVMFHLGSTVIADGGESIALRYPFPSPSPFPLSPSLSLSPSLFPLPLPFPSPPPFSLSFSAPHLPLSYRPPLSIAHAHTLTCTWPGRTEAKAATFFSSPHQGRGERERE